MGANPEFAGIDWIGPAAAGHGSYSHRYIVWHCTDNATSTARGEANFALTRDDGIGTHFVADETSCFQTLETWKAVGHVGSTVGNQRGVALEMCGTEASSTAHYQAVIDRAMPAIRAACARWDIPARWLTEAQANDGVSKGWLTHDDARRYWGQTTHTDPGPNFPRQYALDAFSGNRTTGAIAPKQEEPSEMQTFFQATHPTAGGAKFFGIPGVICTWIQDNARIGELVGLSDAPASGGVPAGGKWGIQLPPDHSAGATPSVHHSLVAIAGAIPPGWDDHAIGGRASIDAAAVAAALAADPTFITAVANAVGNSVKDQFGPAFDARLTAAARAAVNARFDDDATT